MAQATVEHPAEIVTLDGPVTARRPRSLARLGEVRRAHAPTAPTRSTPGSCGPADFDAVDRRTRCCSTSTAARSRSTARRSSTRPRCRPRPASSCVMSNPRGGSGRAHRVGPGDPRSEAPDASRAPAGARSTSTTCIAVLDTALERYPFCDRDRVGMLGGSYGGYMATTARRPATATASGRSARSGRSTTCSPRSGRSDIGTRVPGRARPEPDRGPRRVRCGCRRSGTSATSTCRC